MVSVSGHSLEVESNSGQGGAEYRLARRAAPPASPPSATAPAFQSAGRKHVPLGTAGRLPGSHHACWLKAKAGKIRQRASALLFGSVHLPIQCMASIGTAQLVLTLPWIMTKNLWVSTGAHVINNWTLFSAGLLGAGLVDAP